MLIGGNLKGHKAGHSGLGSDLGRGFEAFEGSFMAKWGVKASLDRCF